MFSSTSLARFLRCSAVLLRAPVSSTTTTSKTAVGESSGFPRLHGTVTGFKHRRGYGFILAEGVVGEVPPGVVAADLMTEYFFSRKALMGGFYIIEGERVSFDVEVRDQRARESDRPAGYVTLAPEDAMEDKSSADTTAAAAVVAGGGDASARGGKSETERVLNLAVRMQMFDLKKGVETPIEPIALRGKVVQWDPVGGRGVIGELDTEGNYHSDAPKFALTMENMDLAAGSEPRAGRYVRFCVEPAEEDGAEMANATEAETEGGATGEADIPLARRVIFDRVMEQRLAVVGRPLAPAGAPKGSVTACSRFSGIIHDINANFGFIRDDLSDESIFFHISNARSRHLQVGDMVTYMLRELTVGKHTGKKACFDVRRARLEGSASSSSSSSAFSRADGGDDDILDVVDDVSSQGESRASSKKSKGGSSSRHRSATDSDDDFDLLD